MASARENLIDIAIRHQHYIERLKTHAANLYSGSALTKAQREITAALNDLGVDVMNELSRRELTAVTRELQRLQETIYADANKAFQDMLKDISGQQAGYQAEWLRAASRAAGVTSKITTPTLTESFRAALQNPLGDGKLLGPFMDSWGERTIDAVNAVVRQAWAQGNTIADVTRSLRGTKAAGYTDGIIGGARRQAEAVARTSVQHVANQAYQETWQQNDDIVKGYRWVATLDSRTTTECRAIDGQVFKFGEGPTPPLHVNCRSTTIPELSSEFDFLDKGAMRSSKDGYVPADQTYYEWLETQPRDFVEEVLGPTRSQLFLDGGLSADEFAKLTISKNWEPLTIDEMRARDEEAFKRAGL